MVPNLCVPLSEFPVATKYLTYVDRTLHCQNGCEIDPRSRRIFSFRAYFRLSPLQKHVRKVLSGFGKKSCVSTGVRKPGNTRASPTAMIMTLTVKVTSNPDTTNQHYDNKGLAYFNNMVTYSVHDRPFSIVCVWYDVKDYWWRFGRCPLYLYGLKKNKF